MTSDITNDGGLKDMNPGKSLRNVKGDRVRRMGMGQCMFLINNLNNNYFA